MSLLIQKRSEICATVKSVHQDPLHYQLTAILTVIRATVVLFVRKYVKLFQFCHRLAICASLPFGLGPLGPAPEPPQVWLGNGWMDNKLCHFSLYSFAVAEPVWGSVTNSSTFFTITITSLNSGC